MVWVLFSLFYLFLFLKAEGGHGFFFTLHMISPLWEQWQGILAGSPNTKIR